MESCSVNLMLPTCIFFLYLFFLYSSLPKYCYAIDTINFKDSISDESGDTLISAEERFQLGFFSPNESSSDARYVGIWYYNFSPKTVVWVANRDNPLSDRNGSFAITEDGNLKLLDSDKNLYWSTNVQSSSSSTTAKLTEFGNLVLSNSINGTLSLWESFQNPTDTFLPGMSMHKTPQLTSWKSKDDPATGNFTFQIVSDNQFIIRKRSLPYWRSAESSKFIHSESDQMRPEILSLLSNFSSNCTRSIGNYNRNTCSQSNPEYRNRRLVMRFTGEIEYFILLSSPDEEEWFSVWKVPRDRCCVLNACGNFGSCVINRELMCECLPGFKPNSADNWNSGDFSGGCIRKSSICGENDTFLGLKMMQTRNPDRITGAPGETQNGRRVRIPDKISLEAPDENSFEASNETECRKECLDDCNCQAYSYYNATVNTSVCWIWENYLSNLQEEYAGGVTLFLRVNPSDLAPPLPPKGHSRRKIPVSSIIAVISAAVIVLIAISCIIVCYLYPWRRRVARRQENRENIQRNQAQHLYGSERQVKDLIDSSKFGEEDKKGIDVPFFDLESILVATNNFSYTNKLGRGGFGPVYKGMLPGGQEIAVKRLSSVSGQGLEEFKNEIILIAKLQHRNLVRLLGYCIEREEKILLYEYMPNKSLDSFIFDQKLCVVLDWELRFNIILGIARGLLYLHQDSRLRIIHRDLKTSNILLDEEMNPKISDFGLAKIFGGKQTEDSTNRVVGTYGYMSPEYANYGFFSIKSDVFSFGVVVLEIISGKRITGFYQSQQALSLLGYAWRLWNEDKALDLMDQTLSESCNTNEFLKCATVGLLCVQEDPSDRPTMLNVVLMLSSETLALPTPKQPAFIVRKDPSSTAASSSKPETWSNNELTVTVEDGR